MKKWTLFLSLIIFISCKESNKKEIELKNKQFNKELYNAILEYQAKVKIPNIENREISPYVKNIKSALIYVYEIKFFINDKDTVASLALNSGGIIQYYNQQIPRNEKIYGIYQDEILKPTYLNDPQKIGRSFVDDYIINENSLKKFYQLEDFINDDIYDIYLYKIKGKKMIFDKILVGNKR